MPQASVCCNGQVSFKHLSLLSFLSRGRSRNNAEVRGSPATTGCCPVGQSCVGEVIICRSAPATFPEPAGPWWSCSLSLAWWKPSWGLADMETRVPKATWPFWHPADPKTCLACSLEGFYLGIHPSVFHDASCWLPIPCLTQRLQTHRLLCHPVGWTTKGIPVQVCPFLGALPQPSFSL